MDDYEILASQAIAQHTKSVREWLAAPFHERGYYWECIVAAWRVALDYRVTDQCVAASTNLLRVNGKVKGIR